MPRTAILTKDPKDSADFGNSRRFDPRKAGHANSHSLSSYLDARGGGPRAKPAPGF